MRLGHDAHISWLYAETNLSRAICNQKKEYFLHHHLMRSSNLFIFQLQDQVGVMSLADNLLHASWYFDWRVKLRNIIPLPCRNRSENAENAVHFISNNSLLCKLILQLKILVFTMLSHSYAGKNCCWKHMLGKPAA